MLTERLGTVLAETKDVHHMARLGKTVLCSNLACPSFDGFSFDFFGVSTLPTYQVMVVSVARACPVEVLALRGLQGIRFIR